MNNVSTFIVQSGIQKLAFGIPECTINVDTSDLFSRRPDDDKIQLIYVAFLFFFFVCLYNYELQP